ncbi:MAG: hypothetical protein WD739_07495 [Actinomycetota bacterium]
MTINDGNTNQQLDALAGKYPDNAGVCGQCQRTVDNTDPNHRVTPILEGGRGVECKFRGDYR